MTNKNNLKMIFVAALFAQNGLISNINSNDNNFSKIKDFGLKSLTDTSMDFTFNIFEIYGLSIFSGVNILIERNYANYLSYGAGAIFNVIAPGSLIKEAGIISNSYISISLFGGGVTNFIAENVMNNLNAGIVCHFGYNFTDYFAVEGGVQYSKNKKGVPFNFAFIYKKDNKFRGRINKTV